MGPSRECDGDGGDAVGDVGGPVRLQWGRRVNATETVRIREERRIGVLASMGPSRECDGDNFGVTEAVLGVEASMGPSRECDGDINVRLVSPGRLQASMGPSRECDGDINTQDTRRARRAELQWGRRVNATETRQFRDAFRPFSLLQWGRRVNATETAALSKGGWAVFQMLQWGRRVNATETRQEEAQERSPWEASMGPSRECDGDYMAWW